ncbi:hypothetical protein IWZ01DRAFT_190095 [Phyllosticta capitalensis]
MLISVFTATAHPFRCTKPFTRPPWRARAAHGARMSPAKSMASQPVGKLGVVVVHHPHCRAGCGWDADAGCSIGQVRLMREAALPRARRVRCAVRVQPAEVATGGRTVDRQIRRSSSEDLAKPSRNFCAPLLCRPDSSTNSTPLSVCPSQSAILATIIHREMSNKLIFHVLPWSIALACISPHASSTRCSLRLASLTTHQGPRSGLPASASSFICPSTRQMSLSQAIAC